MRVLSIHILFAVMTIFFIANPSFTQNSMPDTDNRNCSQQLSAFSGIKAHLLRKSIIQASHPAEDFDDIAPMYQICESWLVEQYLDMVSDLTISEIPAFVRQTRILVKQYGFNLLSVLKPLKEQLLNLQIYAEAEDYPADNAEELDGFDSSMQISLSSLIQELEAIAFEPGAGKFWGQHFPESQTLALEKYNFFDFFSAIGYYNQAIEDWTKLSQNVPSDIPIDQEEMFIAWCEGYITSDYEMIGLCCGFLGNWPLSFENWSKAEQRHFDFNSPFLNSFAAQYNVTQILLFYYNKVDEATARALSIHQQAQALGNASDFRPLQFQAITLLAQCHIRNENYEYAESLLIQANTIIDQYELPEATVETKYLDYAIVAYNLGMVYDNLGRIDEAKAQYQIARENLCREFQSAIMNRPEYKEQIKTFKQWVAGRELVRINRETSTTLFNNRGEPDDMAKVFYTFQYVPPVKGDISYSFDFEIITKPLDGASPEVIYSRTIDVPVMTSEAHFFEWNGTHNAGNYAEAAYYEARVTHYSLETVNSPDIPEDPGTPEVPAKRGKGSIVTKDGKAFRKWVISVDSIDLGVIEFWIDEEKSDSFYVLTNDPLLKSNKNEFSFFYNCIWPAAPLDKKNRQLDLKIYDSDNRLYFKDFIDSYNEVQNEYTWDGLPNQISVSKVPNDITSDVYKIVISIITSEDSKFDFPIKNLEHSLSVVSIKPYISSDYNIKNILDDWKDKDGLSSSPMYMFRKDDPIYIKITGLKTDEIIGTSKFPIKIQSGSDPNNYIEMNIVAMNYPNLHYCYEVETPIFLSETTQKGRPDIGVENEELLTFSIKRPPTSNNSDPGYEPSWKVLVDRSEYGLEWQDYKKPFEHDSLPPLENVQSNANDFEKFFKSSFWQGYYYSNNKVKREHFKEKTCSQFFDSADICYWSGHGGVAKNGLLGYTVPMVTIDIVEEVSSGTTTKGLYHQDCKFGGTDSEILIFDCCFFMKADNEPIFGQSIEQGDHVPPISHTDDPVPPISHDQICNELKMMMNGVHVACGFANIVNDIEGFQEQFVLNLEMGYSYREAWLKTSKSLLPPTSKTLVRVFYADYCRNERSNFDEGPILQNPDPDSDTRYDFVDVLIYCENN